MLQLIRDKNIDVLKIKDSHKKDWVEVRGKKGYEIGGKTGTAEKVVVGGYTRKAKVNTFASIFPTSKPKYVMIVLLDEPKTSEDYVYKYKNKGGSYKGTPFNTAGWTSVEVAGKIIQRIGPILATKYIEN